MTTTLKGQTDRKSVRRTVSDQSVSQSDRQEDRQRVEIVEAIPTANNRKIIFCLNS